MPVGVKVPEKVALLPGAIGDGRPIGIGRDHRQVRGVCPAATLELKLSGVVPPEPPV